jgi:hypothetical protein
MPITKNDGDPKGPSPELELLRKDLASTAAKLEIATAEASFTDDQRAVYGRLDESGKVEFRKLDVDGRRARVAQAVGENPVVYTSEGGEFFRKNDDPRIVAMAKRADEQTRIARSDREALVLERLEKRAGELNHLPESKPGVKVALLKAIDGIADKDLRDGALALVKAGNENLAGAFAPAAGVSFGPEIGATGNQANDAAVKLRKMAETNVENGKAKTIEQGYALAMGTREGYALSKASTNGGQ